MFGRVFFKKATIDQVVSFLESNPGVRVRTKECKSPHYMMYDDETDGVRLYTQYDNYELREDMWRDCRWKLYTRKKLREPKIKFKDVL